MILSKITNDKETIDLWANCVGDLISSAYDNLDSYGYCSQLGDLTIEREGTHND